MKYQLRVTNRTLTVTAKRGYSKGWRHSCQETEGEFASIAANKRQRTGACLVSP
jgi:hypothetical protein